MSSSVGISFGNHARILAVLQVSADYLAAGTRKRTESSSHEFGKAKRTSTYISRSISTSQAGRDEFGGMQLANLEGVRTIRDGYITALALVCRI